MFLLVKKYLIKIISIILIYIFLLGYEVSAEDNIYIYSNEYSIEYFLRNYNVVTLGVRQPNSYINDYDSSDLYGNIENLMHVVGPIIVEGNLGEINQQIYHSQFVKGISSYIKGEILASGGAGGKMSDGTNSVLYVGSINNIEQPDLQYHNYHINGYNWYTNYETIKTDYYIDFQKLYNEIVKQQEKIYIGDTITKDDSGNIYIKTGGIYNIESLDGVNNIVFDEFIQNQEKLTLINILDKGDDKGYIKFPRIVSYNDGNFSEIYTNDYYGKNGNTNEIYKGNVVWNILNASYVEMDKSPFIGHFIAPQADVKMPEMHFAGCFIVNSLYGSGNTEGHMYSLDTNIVLPSDLIVDDASDESINPDTKLDEAEYNNKMNNDNIVDSNFNSEKNNVFDNPNTLDSISTYIILICISVIIILTSYLVYKKILNNGI